MYWRINGLLSDATALATRELELHRPRVLSGKFFNAAWSRSRFLRDVGVLTGGTLFAQGLALDALLILTRIYSSPIVLVVGAASLLFDVAVVLHEHDEIAIDLLRLPMLSDSCLAIFVGIEVYRVPGKLVEILGSTGLESYIWCCQSASSW